MAVSAGCIDLAEVYPPGRAPVCVRGTVGCAILHEAAKEAAATDALLSTSLRPSDDFEGCVE